MNIYRALYTRFGGRPWTYIIRQFTKENPWITGSLVLISLMVLARLLPLSWLTVIMVALLVGFLMGHLFWDTRGPYIPFTKGLRRRR